MNDRLPKWYVYKMLSVKQLGLDKGKEWRDTGDPDFRFIAVGENLRRLYWKSTFKLSGECFKEYSEPFQLALGTKGGGQCLRIRNSTNDGTQPRPPIRENRHREHVRGSQAERRNKKMY